MSNSSDEEDESDDDDDFHPFVGFIQERLVLLLIHS
jgi:hypothetical protein